MRTIPIALAAHQALATTTLAVAMRIERKDGAVYAFTSHETSVTIAGDLYDATQGLDLTDLLTSAGNGVDNLEITTLHDGTLFTKPDVSGGVWRNAAFKIFVYNYESPADGIDVRLVGNFGEVEVRRGTVHAELRGLQQYLQQPVGSPSSKTCRYQLGDSRCTVDLVPLTFTGTITSVTSPQVFRDSARTEALEWFTEGVFTFTGGANDGLSQKVKGYLADGTFTLSLPMLQTVTIGDTYSVITGCIKRFDEDCVAKFDNGLNFGGEPHRPGIDALTESPEVSV